MFDFYYYLITGVISSVYSIYAFNKLANSKFMKRKLNTDTNYITTKEAKYLLSNNKVDIIIDVRTKTEYNIGHYNGSVNIPVNDLTKTSVDKITNKNPKTRILVYCRSGRRAKVAVDKLKMFGYKNIKYIKSEYTSLL